MKLTERQAKGLTSHRLQGPNPLHPITPPPPEQPPAGPTPTPTPSPMPTPNATGKIAVEAAAASEQRSAAPPDATNGTVPSPSTSGAAIPEARAMRPRPRRMYPLPTCIPSNILPGAASAEGGIARLFWFQIG
ncbi:hypothetical protein B0H14DRAFT_3490005 [Mycena olivaceomarginata]|nr:hypothetical protein B0H14DRAFT_3490005 [Mycena olivaceomarginata]